MTQTTQQKLLLWLPFFFLLLYLVPKVYITQYTHSTASSVSAGNNINITTAKGNDQQVLIQGSHLQAGNTINVDTETLNILASHDTSSSNSESKSVSASLTVGTAGVTGASVGAGMSKDKTKSSTYNNSTLNANTINLTSTKDTNIASANIHANKETT